MLDAGDVTPDDVGAKGIAVFGMEDLLPPNQFERALTAAFNTVCVGLTDAGVPGVVMIVVPGVGVFGRVNI